MKYSKAKSNQNKILRNQLSSLILNEQIKTTTDKAKALKKEAERLISWAKSAPELKLTKKLQGLLYSGSAVKLIEQKDKYESVSTLRLGPRMGDGAPISIVKLNIGKPKIKEAKK